MEKTGLLYSIKKEWLYYLTGFLIVVLPVWIFSYLSSEFGMKPFYSGELGKYTFYATPLLLGVGIGIFLKAHLRSLSWGIFLGHFLFSNLLNLNGFTLSNGRVATLQFLIAAGFVTAVCIGAGVAISFPTLVKKIWARERDRYFANARRRRK